MADNNQILFSVGFDSAKLDAELKKFGRAFKSSLKASLADLDLSKEVQKALGVNQRIALKFNLAGTQREFDRIKSSLKLTVPLKFDLTEAKAQIASIQDNIKKLEAQVAASTAKAGGTTVTGSTVAPTILNAAAITINPAAIDAARNSLATLQAQIRSTGASEVEATKQTSQFTTALANIAKGFQQVEVARTARGVGGGSTALTDSEIKKLLQLQVALENVNNEMLTFDKRAAQLDIASERSSQFMGSFGFKIGILGFSMSILGGQLQRLSQAMVQFVNDSVKAVEPLERVTNLIQQLVDEGTINPKDKTFILSELNRLADLPGANLDSVTAAFRQLSTLGLEFSDTLKLIEGLLKAAGRAGTGPQGLSRLAEQLRQFVTSGQLTQRDIRTITEQGGVEVQRALQRAFGTTDATQLELIGARNVILGLTKELEKVPAPLATTSDILNRVNNSFIRMRELILQILRPGLESLLDKMHSLENVITSFSKSLDNLSPRIKVILSDLTLFVVGFAAAGSVILGVLGTIAIAGAGTKHTFDAIKVATGAVAASVGKTAEEVGLFAAAGLKLKDIVAPLGITFKLWSAGILSTGAALATLSGEVGGFTALVLKLVGLSGPIGIIINLVLALVTNAGHARDVVVGALGQLSTAFGKLFDQLSQLSQGPVGQALFNFINALVNLLGGLLGDALAGIIFLLTDVIELITSFVDVLNNLGNIDKLNNFAKTLFNTLVDPITKLGALMGASFIDAIADVIPAKGKTPSTTSTFLLGAGPSLALSSGADSLHAFAAQTRANVLGTTSATAQTTAKDLDQIHQSIISINTALTESNKILDKMQDSVDEVGRRFAKLNADLRINQIKFFTDQNIKQAQSEFDKLLNSDIEAAKAKLPKLFGQIAQSSTGALAAETREELNTVFDELGKKFSTIKSLVPPVLIEQSQKDAVAVGDALNSFKDSIKVIGTLIQQGKTNLADFDQPIKNATTAANNFINTFRGKVIGEKEKESFKDWESAINDTSKSLDDLLNTLGKRSTEEQKIQQQRITNEKEYTRKIEERQKALDALDRTLPLKKQLEELQAQLDTEEHLQDVEGFRADRLTRINTLQGQIQALESKISKEGEINVDQLRDKQRLHDNIIKSLQLQNQQLIAMRQIVKSITDDFESARANAVNILKSILAARREIVGVLPELSNPNAINDQLNTAINTTRRQLIARELKDIQIDPTVRKQLEGILDSLNDFSGKFEQDITTFILSLDKLAIETDTKLQAVTFEIQQGEKQGKPEEVLKPLRAEQLRLLGIANNITKVEKGINTIYGERSDIVKNQLDIITQVYRIDIARLQVIQQQLELQAEVQNAELNNAQARQNAPGTSVFGRLDNRAVDAANQAALKTEIELIKTRIALRKDELEVLRQGALQDAILHKATKEQLDAINKLYDDQITLLTKLGLIQVDNANLKAAADSANEFRNALDNILDIANEGVLSNVSEQLNKFLKNIKDWSGGMADVGQLLGGVVAVAFIGALQGIADSLITFLESGKASLAAFGEFLGTILISLGEQIIQMATAAIAWAAIQGFFDGLPGGIFSALAKAAAYALAATAFVAPLIAVGAGLILAGTALGGKGKHTVNDTAKANSANGANTATGAKPDDNFDPSKDIRTIYQKALMAQITIDIRTDDTQIVKTIIKHVNQNGRLTTLIGNRSLQFGY